MAIGEYDAVDGVDGLHYLDVGLYDMLEYGSVYLLDAERPAIVDTGLGVNHERILEVCAELGIDPAVIAPTHVHLDHAGGAGYLARDCPDATVYIHERGARHLADPTRLVAGTKQAVGDRWKYYAEPVPVDEDRIVSLTDGDVIDLGDRALRAHHAPGHAPHHMVYELVDEGAVFTADAAGIYVPATDEVRPTTPPANFDLEQSLRDIELLQELAPETLLYGHFGPAPTDDRLETYAEVLTEWVSTVERARADLPDDDAVVERMAEQMVAEIGDVWGDWQARAEAVLNTRGVLGYLDRRE